MEIIRTIYYTDEFKAFFKTLDLRIQDKYDQTFDIIQRASVLSTKFVKKIMNSNLYEMRVSVGNNEYRTVLFAIDNKNIISSTKIIVLNSFLKKSSKDYEKQIRKAIRMIENLEI